MASHPPSPQASGRVCPHCGSHHVGKVRGLQGFTEVMICIVLFFVFIIPGVIYYIYMESVPYCSGCGRRVYSPNVIGTQEQRDDFKEP